MVERSNLSGVLPWSKNMHMTPVCDSELIPLTVGAESLTLSRNQGRPLCVLLVFSLLFFWDCWMFRVWALGMYLSPIIVWSRRWGDFKARRAKFFWQLTDMEAAARCPPLIHNQPSNTLLPQWFNCPICHHCCSHQNKRPDNDHFHPRTRHGAFHSWSKVSKMPHFWADKLFILSHL